MAFAAIDFDALLQVIWVAPVAGVGVTTIFSLLVLGSARGAEARRDGRRGAAALYFTLAGLAFAAFVAGVVFGVAIMLNK